MPTCPECGSTSRVLESRKNKSGDVRRRYSCTSVECRFRWTEFNGDPPKKSGPGFTSENPFTEEDIREILVSPETSAALARKYKKSETSIGKIRRGELFADILPEIPRRKSRKSSRASCYKCLHCVEKACKLGWPDLAEDGPLVAAKYCNDYDPWEN